MVKHKNISSELEGRLSTLQPKQHMKVAIMVYSKDNMETLTDYLGGQQVDIQDQDTIPILRTVMAKLTKTQIYGVAKQSYVKTILEDQKIYPSQTR